ncbi:hypothetical protein DR62_07790 [Burkholderia thailandensis]|nr:hypothetical protein DR62_07790 [Burkholderia thailandensis]AOI55499.1 hypothetical protein WI24_27605 [Burkholderia thailandensis]
MRDCSRKDIGFHRKMSESILWRASWTVAHRTYSMISAKWMDLEYPIFCYVIFRKTIDLKAGAI